MGEICGTGVHWKCASWTVKSDCDKPFPAQLSRQPTSRDVTARGIISESTVDSLPGTAGDVCLVIEVRRRGRRGVSWTARIKTIPNNCTSRGNNCDVTYQQGQKRSNSARCLGVNHCFRQTPVSPRDKCISHPSPPLHHHRSRDVQGPGDKWSTRRDGGQSLAPYFTVTGHSRICAGRDRTVCLKGLFLLGDICHSQ
ncbi:hypothetical protein J6590_037815 [Homalodisca vitripennis]|nr:hypothetical protein J6590_037815 [Homalodisca vitripennis]